MPAARCPRGSWPSPGPPRPSSGACWHPRSACPTTAGANRTVSCRSPATRATRPAGVDKGRARFPHGPLVVVVVAVLDPEDAAIPGQERLLTAGCACFALLQAAQGLGFGATWLTGWPAYDPAVQALLGLGTHERVAGFIHIGTPTSEPPERARPDAAALLREWVPPA